MTGFVVRRRAPSSPPRSLRPPASTSSTYVARTPPATGGLSARCWSAAATPAARPRHRPLLTPSLINGTGTAGVAVTRTGRRRRHRRLEHRRRRVLHRRRHRDGDDACSRRRHRPRAWTPPSRRRRRTPCREGAHVVSIRSQGRARATGARPVTVNLTVDKTGPTTSGVSAAPNPNNGVLPFNASTPAVRVTAATMSDPIAGSVRQHDRARPRPSSTPSVPPASGIPLAAGDGVFNEPVGSRVHRHPAGDRPRTRQRHPHHLRARQGRRRQLGPVTSSTS